MSEDEKRAFILSCKVWEKQYCPMLGWDWKTDKTAIMNPLEQECDYFQECVYQLLEEYGLTDFTVEGSVEDRDGKTLLVAKVAPRV